MRRRTSAGKTQVNGSQGAEQARLTESNDLRGSPWRLWGPYVSERAWGTVREDYSDNGDAWNYFPHDQARSRAYRWSEDGLAAICDINQYLCFGLALWNGRDPILKERIFGLTGPEGNHGEDAKEYWWYLDSTPTHSWMRWRYHYPQAEYPYTRLAEESRRRSRHEPEFELLDTGIFDDNRYWIVTVDYAKAGPDDICVSIKARNAGPDEAELHILPTLWFRNTWTWEENGYRPRLRAGSYRTIVVEDRRLGRYALSSDTAGPRLFCDNETNLERLYGVRHAAPWPKDGINDHVVGGKATLNPDETGTKAAFHHRVTVPGGQTAEIRLRLRAQEGGGAPDLSQNWEAAMSDRLREANEFYAALTPSDATPEETMVMRQAFAGMLWTKQFYHLDIKRWLEGDPTQPQPPYSRYYGRNMHWPHLYNTDIISMPDKWEYPWYAAWDLAFHCVALVHVDPEFAKHQLRLMVREWYMHPNGQLPAYEWSFSDVNPPVHAWAALVVFLLDGAKDIEFLERIFHKLTLNFTWWVNRKDSVGKNVFEGGFLGLDNIGPFDRSARLPTGGSLEQADATAWMSEFCIDMLLMSIILAAHKPVYEDVATKFYEHFAYIATAMNSQGLWNEEDGFYYDQIRRPDGSTFPLKVRSMVGLLPLVAAVVVDAAAISHMPDFIERFRWFTTNRPEFGDVLARANVGEDNPAALLSIVGPERFQRIMEKVLSPAEFYSPHGLRSLSRYHREHPLDVDLGGVHAYVGYEPAESMTGMFGGNSNWRGPVWFPVNVLVLQKLRWYHLALGDDFLVELPTGSGNKVTLGAVIRDLEHRLISLFLNDSNGRRPVFGNVRKFQEDPEWHDLLLFYEYFDGDTGAGLGASHQTGWTGLVAHLIAQRRFGRMGGTAEEVRAWYESIRSDLFSSAATREAQAAR